MINLKVVAEKERLSRYLDEGSKYKPAKNKVNFNAFTPPPANFKLSIYRTEELGEAEIWKLGDDYVAPMRKKEIKARADLSAIEFTSRGLTLEPTTQPHERHANAVGWPREKDGENGWLKIATELANAAELKIR